MSDFNTKGQAVVDWLQQEFNGIRSGQAAPAILDSVRVEQYGSKLPLNQVSTIGVEDARTLRVSPWDIGLVGAIEGAIRDADLGVSIATDSSGLRVIFPELTSERRGQLQRLAKQKHEEARVSVRSVRDDCMKDIDRQEKAGDISEDERFTQKEALQKQVDAINVTLDDILAHKETELTK